MHAVPLLVGSRKRLVLDALPKFLYSSVIKMVSQPYFATNPILKEAKNRAPASEDAYRRYMSSGQGEGKTTHTKSGKKRRVATNRAKRGHGRYVIQQAGLLKKSIRRQRLTKNSREIHRAAVGIGVHLKGKTGETAFYWHMVERGTKNMPAVPFLRPAFDHHKDEAVQRFKKKLGERIDKLK
ncbi:HK97-gp10 family putative phage morphogenesis protein [Moraxella catarrhalis]|uniref:HK97-gp10 family putative phage morphogenesis protein n=1 Tax=Moraxella catarrhalis TaxID=480 RepID=UPI0018C86CC8|nr:HK97-gp10 family putative phage morphogenesis protein [Moraxella catarrhalis]